MAETHDRNKWEELATKELRGKPLEELTWMTTGRACRQAAVYCRRP